MKRGVIFILLTVVFLTSCEGLNPNKSGTDTGGAFIGGKQGIQVAFAEDEPPKKVLDNNQQEFFVTLLLKNQGEFTVPEGGLIASLSGVSKKSFGLTTLNIKNTFPIAGAQKDIGGSTPGGEELLEFGEAKYTNDIPADFQTNLRADICYDYQTKAIANLCLKKDVLRKDIDDVCAVKVANLKAQNSGGPFQVISMRQNTVGKNRIKLNFKVKNIGNGAIYEPKTFTNICAGQEANKDRVKITLTSPENNFKLECSQFGGKNEGIIRLVNGEKDISCTIDTTTLQEVTFQDLLIVEMDYMYRNAVVTQLTVENAV